MPLCSALGVETVVCDRGKMEFGDKSFTGVLLQYPDTEGSIYDMADIVEAAHQDGVSFVPSKENMGSYYFWVAKGL